MLTSRLTSFLALALCLPFAHGCRNRKRGMDSFPEYQAVTNLQSIAVKLRDQVPLVEVSLDHKQTFSTNTTEAANVQVAAGAVQAETVTSTVLVIARDTASAYSAYSGLNDHGIPYQVQIVPPTGASLPSMNDSATTGNYGLIVIVSEVSYLNNNTGDYESALTDTQWTSLYNYQVSFGVRMVRLDVAPSVATGTTSLGGCCETGEQLVSISNNTFFPTAGLKL